MKTPDDCGLAMLLDHRIKFQRCTFNEGDMWSIQRTDAWQNIAIIAFSSGRFRWISRMHFSDLARLECFLALLN
jgi:hypothetical protein